MSVVKLNKLKYYCLIMNLTSQKRVLKSLVMLQSELEISGDGEQASFRQHSLQSVRLLR